MRARVPRSALALALLGLLALPGAAPAQQQRQRLAYAHDARIYTIDSAGADRRLVIGSVARGGPFSYGDPEWSPDGAALAFTRSRPGRDDELSQLQVRSGGVTRSLTPLARGTSASTPAFSPDGRTIAYARGQGTGDDVESQIATIPAAGGSPTVVVRQPPGEDLDTVVEPAWTPDGRLAYTLLRYQDSKLRPLVYTVRPDGSDRRLILRDAYSPAWSPDGSRMVFVSIRDRNGEDCDSDLCSYRGELYVARADAAGQRRLTRNRGDDSEPAWSPDGSRILFTSTRNFPAGEGGELYTVTPEGRCVTWLTNGAPASGSGDWQPGSGQGTDAGGCGAVGRRALIETRLAPRSGAGALWLGRSFRGLLLTDTYAGAESEEPDFSYEDCGRFDPRQCLPSAYLTSNSVCRREAFQALRFSTATRVRRFRGAVLATGGDFTDLYTGGIDQGVQVQGGGRSAEAAVLRGLYRFGRPRPRAGSRLPAPRVSPARARALRAAVRARRRHGSARAAARALGLEPSTVRARLRIARALAPLRTTACR